MRDSLATELFESRHDIRTVQEMLGHKDVRTTMTYLHIIDDGWAGVTNPLHRL